jgi:anti-sigma regulatory factor (Ser/Thr protein kinase)
VQSDQPAARDGRSSWRYRAVAAQLGGNRLRAACRRSAGLLRRLTETVVATLHAHPAETRRGDDVGSGGGRVPAPWTLKAWLPLDTSAPGAARQLAVGLGGRVTAPLVENVQLVVSELVTNSVRHSGAAADSHVGLWIALLDTAVRVEVTDLGGNGGVMPHPPDFERGGGFGLNLVRAVAERWGLEQSVAGGTRVWAELSRTAAVNGARQAPLGQR